MGRPSMRAELRDFKRERILEEVLDLFYQRGFHGTTLEAVAERLQVTKPFIYQFFRGKEELLVTLYERGARRLLALIDESLADDAPARDRLHGFVRKFATQNLENQAISAVFLQEEKNVPAVSLAAIRKLQHEFDDKLTILIEDGVAGGEFVVPEARLAALAIAGMVRWIHRWYRPGGRLGMEEIAERFATLALAMVSAPEDPEPRPARGARIAVRRPAPGGKARGERP